MIFGAYGKRCISPRVQRLPVNHTEREGDCHHGEPIPAGHGISFSNRRDKGAFRKCRLYWVEDRRINGSIGALSDNGCLRQLLFRRTPDTIAGLGALPRKQTVNIINILPWLPISIHENAVTAPWMHVQCLYIFQ
jgi:hypothetical protein